jgi:Ser/Thr protein kinase RdoA (MazF antagonist)
MNPGAPLRPDESDLAQVIHDYGLGPVRSVERLESGHINETFRVRLEGRSVLLQWINPHVFPRAGQVQDNVERVLSFLDRTDACPHPKLLTTPRGLERNETTVGLWRAFEWLEGRRTLARPGSAGDARTAGHALGRFLAALAGLPPGALHDTLPGFHDLDVRLAELDTARDCPAADRDGARELLAEVDARRDAFRESVDAGPDRVIHGDPKFTNILLPAPGIEVEPVVVDLDTLMPGRLVLDLGDFLRSAASAGDEDAPGEAGVDDAALVAGAEGLVAGLGRFDEDPGMLAAGPGHMSFMLAVRFLADHLGGDRYFRVHRPGQNLDRARTQLALASAFDARRRRLAEVLAGACG